jgi:hypothetical protein
LHETRVAGAVAVEVEVEGEVVEEVEGEVVLRCPPCGIW